MRLVVAVALAFSIHGCGDGRPDEAQARAPGGLPIAQLLDLAIPLANRSVAAREKAVVHCDLNPANRLAVTPTRVRAC